MPTILKSNLYNNDFDIISVLNLCMWKKVSFYSRYYFNFYIVIILNAGLVLDNDRCHECNVEMCVAA